MSTTATFESVLARLFRLGSPFRFENDPALQVHPVFHPESQWTNTSKPEHTNAVARVRTSDGGDWFVKKTVQNPEESHTEPAARHVMRTLGFKEVPQIERVISPVTGHPHVVGPWVEPQPEQYNNFRSQHGSINSWQDAGVQQMFQKFGHKRIPDLLATHWLIHAIDRNPGNYIIDKDWNLVPTDYGETWSILPWGNRPGDTYVREERENSPQADSLFQLARNAGVVGWSTPLNERFLKYLKIKEPFIRDIFERQVAPHLPADDVYSARQGMNERFEHIGKLIDWFKDKSVAPPTLGDLPKYLGNERAE